VSCWIANTGLQLHAPVRALTASEAQRLNVWRLGPILLIFIFLVGCGGRGVVGSNNFPSPNPTPTPVAAPATPTPVAPTPTPPTPAPPPSTGAVSLAAGQKLTGVDVIVAAPSVGSPPNAEDLGVNPVSGLGSASNTGGAIHRGSTMRVLLFGPGLSDGMKVTVAGPSDVTVSNIQLIQATDNTPGVAFTAVVASNASLGARTVFLQSTKGDVTSFTGGLEVIP